MRTAEDGVFEMPFAEVGTGRSASLKSSCQRILFSRLRPALVRRQIAVSTAAMSVAGSYGGMSGLSGAAQHAHAPAKGARRWRGLRDGVMALVRSTKKARPCH